MRYFFKVYELQRVEYTYIVTADTEEEARRCIREGVGDVEAECEGHNETVSVEIADLLETSAA